MARKKKARSVGVSFFAFQDIITGVSGILIIIVLVLVTKIQPPGVSAEPVEIPNDLGIEDLEKSLNDAEKKNKELEKKRLAFVGRSAQQIESDIAQLQQSLAEDEEKKKALLQNAARQAAAASERDEKLGLNALQQQIEKEKVKVSRLESEKDKLEGEVERLNGDKQAKADALGKAEKTLWVVPGESTEKPLICVVGGAEVSLTDTDKPTDKKVIPDGDLAAQFQAQLANYDPASNYVVFWIRPSGIGRYETLRGLAKAAGFAVGTEAVTEDAAVSFGAGE